MQFTLESYLNPYLPSGTARVDAIITISALGDPKAATRAQSVVGLIMDMSGSMEGNRITAAKQAICRAIELIDDSASFFVISFSDHANMVCELKPATRHNKVQAQTQVKALTAHGGTRMSTGLKLAQETFSAIPNAIQYALFLTDGKNHPDDEVHLDKILPSCEGVFQCDCRGVGTDWQPKQLQKIARKLLGTAMIIPEPAGIEADFREAIENAMRRNIGDVRLRLWTPKSAAILACKQMSPEIVVLTDRAVQVDAQARDYPTGAWGAESRDYYIAIEIQPGEIGDEVLACRPSVVYNEGLREVKVTGAPIVAAWTDDEALSARISEQVAHYTGQEELAAVIQKGLDARAQGDDEAATRFLGRAAKLANDSGHSDTIKRLSKVVDIVDADHGTVKLKSKVAKADEMDLDLASTRTARARRTPQTGTEGNA